MGGSSEKREAHPCYFIQLFVVVKEKTPLAGDCGVFIETETLTVF
jgi:hypothetical protein